MLEYLYLTCRVLFTVSIWKLPWPINKHWDKRLRYSLEHGPHFEYYHTDPKADWCILLNNKLIMIPSFPKNYGTRVNGATVGHPSRKTMLLLRDMIKDFKEYG